MASEERPYYFRSVSSATGILAETVLLTIVEEDENGQTIPIPSPTNTAARCIEQLTPSHTKPNSSSSSFSWADDADEELGPVPSPSNIQQKATYTKADFLESQGITELSALLIYTGKRFYAENISDDDYDNWSQDGSESPPEAQLNQIHGDSLGACQYQYRGEAIVFYDEENKADLAEWREMKKAEKPAHLLRDYDLYLGRCKNREELWYNDMKMLAKDWDYIESFVQARLSQIRDKWKAAEGRRKTV